MEIRVPVRVAPNSQVHTASEPNLEMVTTVHGKGWDLWLLRHKAHLDKKNLLAFLSVDGTLPSMGGPGYFNDILFAWLCVNLGIFR